MTALVVHADDLTGAAETAALFRHVSPAGTSLQLHSGRPGDGLTVIDLDTRNLPAEEAERRARQALERTGVPLFTKLDSMLRGNYTAHLRALDPANHPIVLTPALPAAGRHVVDGHLLIPGGTPINLHDTLPSGITIADASTDEDLDRLLDATWHLPGVRYAGAGGLAAALARRLTTSCTTPTTPLEATGILYVVGTAEPIAQHQLTTLQEQAELEEVTITPNSSVEVARLGGVLAQGGTVVLKAPGGSYEPAAVALALGAAAREVLADGNGQAALVLTGGHTARTVLEVLGVEQLDVVDEIHHGAVLSRTGDGRPVVTRPGSFGERSSFAEIHAVLRPFSVRKATTS
ncbi:four-carbon acid sugar kinase family protein [Kribbella sp. WER1]